MTSNKGPAEAAEWSHCSTVAYRAEEVGLVPESLSRGTAATTLAGLSAGRQSTEQARIPLLPRELVPPGQGWDTVARGGWGWLALPLPVLYLVCG